MRAFIGWIYCLTPWMRRVLAAGLVLVLVALIFHRPLWRGFRGWRAERLVVEAHAHAAAGHWSEVSRAASASHQLRPSLDSLRLLVEAFAQTGQPQVLRAAVGLFVHPGSNTTDRVRAIKIILDKRDLLTAVRLMQQLPESDRDDPDMRYQAVRCHLMTGNYREAVALTDAGPKDQRDPRLDLLIAEGFARSGQSEARSATALRIDRVLGGPDRDLALRAVRLLAALPDTWIHEALAESALDRFRGDTTLDVADQLRLVLFEIGTNKDQRAALIDAAVARHRGQNLDELIDWLGRLGELERVVSLTAPEQHPGGLSAALFQARSRALQALGRLEQLEAELNAPPASLPEIPLLMARASVASLLGKESDKILLWRDTFQAADRDRTRNWFYLISNAAGQVGDTERQMDALARAIEHPLGAPPLAAKLDPLFTWLYEQGDTERLLSISYRLLQREPGNPTLVNNYHYLKVLHSEPTERDLDALRALVTTFPDQAQTRGTLALAQLKSGDPTTALATLDALKAAPAELPPAERAIYAATLVALQRTPEATALATSIDWDALPATEARLLKALVSP